MKFIWGLIAGILLVIIGGTILVIVQAPSLTPLR